MSTNNYNFQKPAVQAPPTGSLNRTTTAFKGGENRPITSNTSAGFKKTNNLGSTAEKFSQMQKKEEKPLDPKNKVQKFEQEINALMDESCILSSEKKLTEALQKGKDAMAKQRYMERYLEENNLTEMLNKELRFSVGLNLATLYEKNDLFQEAINEYSNLTNADNHESNLEGFVRVNMGNIYFRQSNFGMAIKMYKRALDLVPEELRLSMPYKIMKNLAHAYVQQNEIVEAITHYEEIMAKSADFESAFNLIVCYYSKGDKDKMKNQFCDMVGIETYGTGVEEEKHEDEKDKDHTIRDDPLAVELRKRKKQASKIILDSAKLIVPTIEENPIDGYNWVIDFLKGSRSNYPETLSEIEIKKANSYIKEKRIDDSIETLKAFEKKDPKMMAQASTNISFLYFLEGDLQSSEKYVEIALNYDKFNANALVNKGNCLFMKDDYLGAKGNYLEAIGVTTDCVEALYNLTLVNKKLGLYRDALTALQKLQTILPNNPEVLYQHAIIHETLGNNKEARKWYDILLTHCPNDPKIHARIGALYALDLDESQAFHHYNESFRLLPISIETIAWLGIYYVKQSMYERACHYFERASQVNPREVKWKLMVASCYRRMDDLERALKLYKSINDEFPENIECKLELTKVSDSLQ